MHYDEKWMLYVAFDNNLESENLYYCKRHALGILTFSYEILIISQIIPIEPVLRQMPIN